MCACSCRRIGRSVPQARCRKLREVRKTVDFTTQLPLWSRCYVGTRRVVIVGGGNSAGQASLFSLRYCKTCPSPCASIVVSRKTMSQYLISRIENSSHITVYTESEIVALDGDRSLERVSWVNLSTGERTGKDLFRRLRDDRR